jgi:hypothetical protein
MAATATHHDDHHAHEVTVPDAVVDVSKVRLISLAALAVGAAVYFIGGFVGVGTDPDHGVRDFFLAYLCGFVYWACVPLGSLLLSMIGYLAQASWGIVFRRTFQASIRTLPLLALLGLPVVASLFVMNGDQSPFWWSDSVYHKPTEQIALDEDQKEEKAKYVQQGLGEAGHGLTEEQAVERVAAVAAAEGIPPLAAQENLHKIHDWLNPAGFAVRYVIYFAILGTIAFLLHRQARKAEDVADTPAENYKLHVISGPGVPVFVVTMTFFITDWVMSVEPTWVSSMFPVVFMFNTALTTLTFSTLVFYSLTKVPNDPAAAGTRPDLTAIIKDKFRIDIGTLTLGFCMAWAYASFCQFMLVWAGNLPEEIPYYLKRGAGHFDSGANGIGPVTDGSGAVAGEASGWIYLSFILMAFHWLLPFVTLLFREVKTSPRGMRFMACLLLAVCACDVIWWILPSVPHEKTWTHLLMAFGAIAMIGGIWTFVFATQLKKRAILPKNSETKFLAEWGHH